MTQSLCKRGKRDDIWRWIYRATGNKGISCYPPAWINCVLLTSAVADSSPQPHSQVSVHFQAKDTDGTNIPLFMFFRLHSWMCLSLYSFYTSKIFLKCLNDLILRMGFTKKWGKFPVYDFIKFWVEIFFHQTVSNFHWVNSVLWNIRVQEIKFENYMLYSAYTLHDRNAWSNSKLFFCSHVI